MSDGWKPMNADELAALAKQIRLDGLEMARKSGRGGSHLGGSFSAVEIMAVLYGRVLRLDVENPAWDGRDRFLASKNHCVLAHLPALARRGFFDVSELAEFQLDGGRLTGYPLRPEIGLEYSGGSLGMAISVGVGQALTLREKYVSDCESLSISHKGVSSDAVNACFLKNDDLTDTDDNDRIDNETDLTLPRVFVLMGDAELNEGSIWEAFMSAAHYKLDNLVAIIDRNHLSYDGNTEDVMAIEPLEDKLKAFGWDVVTCDGHDVADLVRAFDEVLVDVGGCAGAEDRSGVEVNAGERSVAGRRSSEGKPHVIIADTIKGKGVSFMEGVPSYHHASITEEQYEQAKAELG